MKTSFRCDTWHWALLVSSPDLRSLIGEWWQHSVWMSQILDSSSRICPVKTNGGNQFEEREICLLKISTKSMQILILQDFTLTLRVTRGGGWWWWPTGFYCQPQSPFGLIGVGTGLGLGLGGLGTRAWQFNFERCIFLYGRQTMKDWYWTWIHWKDLWSQVQNINWNDTIEKTGKNIQKESWKCLPKLIPISMCKGWFAWLIIEREDSLLAGWWADGWI